MIKEEKRGGDAVNWKWVKRKKAPPEGDAFKSITVRSSGINQEPLEQLL